MDSVADFSILLPCCCGASNESPIIKRSVNALDTTITRFESSHNHTQPREKLVRRLERKPAGVAPAGFATEREPLSLEGETRAKLDDARFASARVLPKVGIRGTIAIASDDAA